MQAIFISYDQAHHENIINVLNANSCRGYTAFEEVIGRGTKSGEPHYGSHAWPSLASAMFVMVEDEKVDTLLEQLHHLDELKPRLGLRAFVWEITKTI
jgi:nitrogen regulatory protein PII